MKSTYQLVDAAQLCLAHSCVMRPAADRHIQGFMTCELSTLHRTRQPVGILAFSRVLLVVLRLSLVL